MAQGVALSTTEMFFTCPMQRCMLMVKLDDEINTNRPKTRDSMEFRNFIN
jgi:hypothetical protein